MGTHQQKNAVWNMDCDSTVVHGSAIYPGAKQNLFSESIIFREQNGTSMNTGITGIAPIKADSEAQDTALMGQDREETQVPLQGERTETDTIMQSTAPFLYQWIHTYGSAIRWGSSTVR